MNQGGFSLLELLVATAVVAIVAGLGVGGFFVAAQRFEVQNSAQTALQRQAQMVIDELTAQIQPATNLAIATCSGTANSLQVTNSTGVYCFRRDSATGTKLLEDRPGGATPMDLLKTALTSGSGTAGLLTTVDGPTLDGSGNCGTSAGFCPGKTGSAPDNSHTKASVTFRLRYQIPETGSYQTMTFTTTIARRN